MRNAFILFVLLALVVTGVGLAVPNPGVKVAIHILPRDCDRGCARKFPVISSLSDIVTTQPGCGEFDFFPVFYDLNEYYCVEYAVWWPGSFSCVFSECGYSHIGGIVWPGDWIAQCFDGCQAGPSAIPGWGWITVNEPGYVCMVPLEQTGEISVLSCSDDLDHAALSYCAGVCGTPGDDIFGLPVAKATEPTTWGKIKSMFK